MNERNVEALESLINAGVEHVKASPFWPEENEVTRRKLAEFFASRGVLVPSALTYSELGRVPEPDDFYHGMLDQDYRREEYRTAVVNCLEALAKGNL